jgi:hypothetical protein
MGIMGSTQAAATLVRGITPVLKTPLKLEISEEQSGLHPAKEGTAFLGYVVQNQTSDKGVKGHSPIDTRVGAATRRTGRERRQRRIPPQQMSEFCQRKGYGNYEECRPSASPNWVHMDAAAILLA